MKDFVYQINNNECGYAVIKMLLAIVHKNSKYLYMPPSKKEGEKYSLLELKEIAKENGVYLGAFILKNYSEALNIKKPCMMIIKNDTSNHCVLIKKANKSFALVYDPSEGKKLISTKKLFKNINNGIEMMIIESVNKVEQKFSINDLVDKKDNALLVLFESLSILLYFFSAYFINKENYMTMPLILIILGVIFAIIHRLYTYSIMKKFDSRYINYTYDKSPEKRRNNYLLMHKTKKCLFINANNIVINLTSVIAINIVLVLNNYYNFYIIVSTSFLVFLEVLFFSPYIKRKSKKILKLENNLLNKENITFEDYESDYKDIKSKSYLIAKKIDLKRIVFSFTLLMITFMMSGIENQPNINFILLNFAMCFFTYTMLSQSFKDIDKLKESDIYQVRFYYLINNKYYDKLLP